MKYTDKTDLTTKIALYEYGQIRRPDTGKTLFCLNPSDEEHTKENPPRIFSTIIEFEDVIEALEEASDRYFSFIGSDRETEIGKLVNEHLTTHIMSLNMYNGHFNQCYYEWR